MKRWLVILLVTLAVLVLVSPGLIGELAERNVQKGINLAANESGKATVTTESFDKGWFTSEGVYRIVFEDGKLRTVMNAEHPELPSLLIKTTIHHGLFPIDGFTPGLASATSTAQIDSGMGTIIDVPGTLHTQIGLTGDSTFHYVAEKGAYQSAAGEQISWDGADIIFTSNADMTVVSIDGKIHALSVDSTSAHLMIGSMTLKGEQRKTTGGLEVGHGSFDLESMTASDASGDTSLQGLHFDSVAALHDDGASFILRSNVADLDVPGMQDISYDLELELAKLNPEDLATVVSGMRALQSAEPGQDPTELYPGAEADILRLLSAGAEIGIKHFNLKLPLGDVAMDMNIAIKPSPTSTGGSWIGLLMAADASTNISVPATLVDFAQAVNPEIGPLITMGLLKLDGDVYRMAARFDKGLLTVNGAPLPLPMPTQ